MAIAKAKKKQATVEWVDISLSQNESIAMKKAYEDGEKLYNDFERLLDSNYKVTFSTDDYNDCSAVFLIPKGDDHVNAGQILTARGSDPWKALRGALFRHYVLFSGDKWTNHDKQVIDSD